MYNIYFFIKLDFYNLSHIDIRNKQMVLFQEDFEKYPTSIIHTKTSNPSWLRLSAVYQEMGIKNNCFHLVLHNPYLENVNPFREDLTKDEIIAIVKECIENPWYFFREIARVPAPGSPDSSPLLANRGNISTIWLYLNHVTVLLIQIRQTGKSVTIQCILKYILGVAGMNLDIHLLTKDSDLRAKTVDAIKNMMTDLPYYLKIKTKKDINNTEKITIKELGNTLYTSVAQASPKSALNLARGLSPSTNWIDEIAYINNIDISLSPLLAASSAARDTAERNNTFYGNIFTTTPGYLSSKSGRFGYRIYQDCCRWDEHFLDAKNREELYTIIKNNSPSGKVQVLCEFNHRQLGKTDEWLREKIAEAMSSGDDADADFLLKWPKGSEASPISKEDLERIENSIIREPIVDIGISGYITRWYIPRHEFDNKISNRKVIMGLDTSDAVGNDSISMVMLDLHTGEIVATGSYNETNIITFADWLANFLVEYPNIILVPERKSSGMSIIDYVVIILLDNNINPFTRIFNWLVNNLDSYPDIRDSLRFFNRNVLKELYTKYKKHFGYATSGEGKASRMGLYGNTFNFGIKYLSDTIRDNTLIKQLSGLIIKNGRIDHKPGEHDDMVIAFLLSLWFLLNARNLHIYNIKPSDVLFKLSRLLNSNNNNQNEETYEVRNHNESLKQITNLIEIVNNTQDSVLRNIYIAKIKHLSKNLISSKVPNFNIESLINGNKLDKYLTK